MAKKKTIGVAGRAANKDQQSYSHKSDGSAQRMEDVVKN